MIRAGRMRLREQPLLWCIAGIPWLFLFALSIRPLTPIFHARYVLFGLLSVIALLAIGVTTLSARWRAVVLAILLLGNAVGFDRMFHRGYSEQSNWMSMKTIAREVHQAERAAGAGDEPWIVVIGLFQFFDARVTLPEYHVVRLVDSKPKFHSTDAVYYDKPDSYIFKLDEAKAKTVWLIEDSSFEPMALPPGWTVVVVHKRGYARTRLLVRSGPT
jgi:hypothetical protein